MACHVCASLWAMLLLPRLVQGLREDNNDADDSSRTWFLAGSGTNSSGCGRTLDRPCESIVSLKDRIGDGDTIHIAKTRASASKFFPCDSWRYETLVSFTISGLGSSATVGCYLDKDPGVSDKRTNLRIENAEQFAHTLTLRNLRFQKTDIVLVGLSLVLESSSFEDSTLRLFSGDHENISMKLAHTNWTGHSYCGDDEKCVPTGLLWGYGNITELNVEDSNFIQTLTNLTFECNAVASFWRNHYTNSPHEPAVIGGLDVTLGYSTYNTSISVGDSSFTNLFNWSPADSVMNIFYSALIVTFLPFKYSNNDINVTLSNVTFHNNERALTLKGPLENVNVDNCNFSSNIAMHAGAGILLLTSKTLRVRNSTFDGNAAGTIRHGNVREPGEILKVRGDEVQINSKKCKGSITMIGKGGAIRVQKGQAILDGCHFTNNTARILGGSVFVNRKSSLIVRDCYFSNTDTRSVIAQQGDVIYSNGQVKIQGVNLKVNAASNHISLIQHSGEHWSIAVHEATIVCPVGHRLREMNTSAYRVAAWEGLKRSYMLDQLSYFCESCSRHRYSMEKGYLYYRLDHGVYEYFTLMINGKHPSYDFHGTYDYHDITCKDCPYGGNCENNLQAVPNFWGYQYKGNIKFQLCPKGYCCTEARCITYNACATHRTGRLCGECEVGYSEALFSSQCVPDETCGPIWLWPFTLGTGVLYAVVLFFQKDIREFIFSRPDTKKLKGMCCCSGNIPCGKKTGQSYTYKVCEKEAPHDDSNPHGANCGNSEGEGIPLNEKRHPAEDQNNRLANVTNGITPCTDLIQKEIDDTGDKSTDNKNETKPQESRGPSATDIGAILLIIVLYYFQDARLFNVKPANSQGESKHHSMLKTVLLGLFQFRLEVAQFVDKVCLFAGLTASQKLLATTVLVPYVLLMFGFIYIVHVFKRCLDSRMVSVKDTENPFLVRLSTGFMLSLLFTYQRMAQTTFTLLNCVPVGDDNVLFIEGGVNCYVTWQFGVVAYAICCLVPFSFALMLGPGLMQEGKISLGHFFIACLFPFPFTIGWVVLRLAQKKNSEEEVNITPSTKAVIQVLQGPFRTIQTTHFGPICWAGVLIFRRLILVILFTFINTSLIRVISMLFVCFLILLNHVYVQPYKDFFVNVAGSASVSALMIIGGINLVRAGFEAAEYVPQGPNETLMYIMHETENVLMLWFPLVIMSGIFVALFCKIVLTILIKMR